VSPAAHPNAPSGEVRLARGPPRARHPTPAHAFNALTQQDCATTLTRLAIMPRRCSTHPLGKAIPATVLHCAERPVSAPWHCAAYFRTANTLIPRRGGQRNPRMGANDFSMATQDYAVTSGRWEQCSPSLSALCSHPRHCSATPGTATTSPTLLERTGTRRLHARHCTSYGPPSMAPSSRPTDGDRTANLYTTTLKAAPVWAQDSPRRPNRSKILQDGRQFCGTARHAFTRRKIVRHACKLLSPWPIKGGAVPQLQGGRRLAITHTLSAFTTILALAKISTSGTWRPGFLSRLACSPLYEHHSATQYSAPSTPLLDVRPPAGTKIKISVTSFLAPTIERWISAHITS
jgi:hypothetical protein